MPLTLRNVVQLSMVKAGFVPSTEDIEWGNEASLLDTDLNSLSRSHLIRHLKARKEDTFGTRKILLQRLLTSLENEREQKRLIAEEQESNHRKIANLEEQGAIYCVGTNHKGQLGLGDLNHRKKFTVIPQSRGIQVREIWTKNDTVFAVTQDHKVLCWGGSGVGPSGFSSSKLRSKFEVPHLVEGLEEEDVIDISVGANHACALNKHGNVYSWGEGRNGCLGNDSLANCDTPNLVPAFIRDELIQSIDSGEMHVCALSEDGFSLYSWGHPQNGRLGVGKLSVSGEGENQKCLISASPFIIQFPQSKRIKLVSCGAEHTVAVSTDGVFSWGSNDGGRLGHGDFEDRWEPCAIETLKGMHISAISCGTWHSACIVISPPLKKYGWLYTFGSGFNGQLGQGDVKSSPIPQIVPFFYTNHLLLKSIICGSHHNAVLTMDDELYTWGSNLNGCLGRLINNEESTNFTCIPGQCVGFGSIVDRIGRGLPISVACGRGFTIVCTSVYDGPDEKEAATIMLTREKEEAKRKLDQLTKSSLVCKHQERKTELMKEQEKRRTQIQFLTSKRGCTLCDCPGFQIHFSKSSICKECGHSSAHHTIEA